MQVHAFYNPRLSFEQNYIDGPFKFPKCQTPERETKFLGHTISSPFGIPAGPLLNAKFVIQAFKSGYDVCVYKTVRSQYKACNPFPNVLFAHPSDPTNLNLEEAKRGVLADDSCPEDVTKINISNSFGVPSQTPEVWMPDVAKITAFLQSSEHQALNRQQLLILSFQATGKDEVELLRDAEVVAKLAAKTRLNVFELNTSCPNEGKDNLLCFDAELSAKILERVRQNLPEGAKLIVKTAYFEDNQKLEEFALKTAPFVDAYSTINTISTALFDRDGNPALDQNRPTSGVCGAGIKWAGLDQVRRLREILVKHNLEKAIVGVGGILQPQDVEEYLQAGADITMAATGPMFGTV